MEDVRCPLSRCNAHLDADPDLDASTNRAFRDVRDVCPHRDKAEIAVVSAKRVSEMVHRSSVMYLLPYKPLKQRKNTLQRRNGPTNRDGPFCLTYTLQTSTKWHFSGI